MSKRRTKSCSAPIWSANYAFHFLNKALIDVLIQDVIQLIGKYSKQDKMLLLQKGNIGKRKYVSIYDPSNNKWTKNAEDFNPFLQHDCPSAVYGVWNNIFMMCERSHIYKNHKSRLNASTYDLENGQLNIQYELLLDRTKIDVLPHPNSWRGMIHVVNIVMEGYYISYDLKQQRWIKIVKEFDCGYELIMVYAPNNDRLFMVSDDRELFEYDNNGTWSKRAPPLFDMSDYSATIIYKNSIYYFEIDHGEQDEVGEVSGQKYDMIKDKWTDIKPYFISKDISPHAQLKGSVIDDYIILSVKHVHAGGNKRIIIRYNLKNTNTGWELISPMQNLLGVKDILAVTI